MRRESYTPGHESNAENFMARRSLESHGSFFIPYLHSGLSALDCGCGPGTITSGIAVHVKPGPVVGVDIAPSQIDHATTRAAEAGLCNVTFHCADCYALPFNDDHFDRVFSHALMEHLSHPTAMLRELHRVLKPGGFIGVCSPDWGGFLLSPPSPRLDRAIAAYRSLQSSNGGDVEAGRKLGLHLTKAGIKVVQMSARYECYPSPGLVAEYLAQQLDREGDSLSAETFRQWSQSDPCLFAQTWVSAVGVNTP